ncbi:unnamed protein product [Prunus armeniaca]
MDTKRFDTSVPLWILHVDGSANQQGCGAGLVLTTPDGCKIEYALRFNFRTSNNEAEYEALLAGLRLAQSMSARQISIHSDSQLIVNQITADFAAKDAYRQPTNYYKNSRPTRYGRSPGRKIATPTRSHDWPRP